MYTDPFGLDCRDSRGNRIPCAPLTGDLRLARLNNSPSTRGSGFVQRTRSDGSTYQHQGVDLAARSGSHVFAMYDGTVTQVTQADGNAAGTRVTIRSSGAEGETTSYWHMSGTDVTVGQRVLGGTPIGHSGTTGNADPSVSGREAHLHVRKQVNGEDVDPGLP
jgi:murein DD-endopeptidase MepM/ murein hydrolase activator NlpD